MTDYNPNSTDAVLARIEGKIDGIISKIDDHEKRIRRTEAWMLKIIGASGAISAGVALVIKLVEIR